MTTFNLKEALRGLYTPSQLTPEVERILDELDDFWGINIRQILSVAEICRLVAGCTEHGKLNVDQFEVMIEFNPSITPAFEQARPF